MQSLGFNIIFLDNERITPMAFNLNFLMVSLNVAIFCCFITTANDESFFPLNYQNTFLFSCPVTTKVQ